ncbi:NAD(P)-dependent oxidoreductase [Nocardia caishijiensis]|uniref:3-hydroxyisobutyrate dehydrogenase-like beta-hydroxyacid dehydrogenase n=1 Tax=Nocardia caishijiensis TaxID=184756 RepID=A0ABQ6YGF7_9NOCA|nr:NAD(P)-dependent oxidoreductase [Nocardia caishijiensis]KAF0844854.1 3-hydroxyisobutyrate dehydrogenase-like beta-hydroxyacid dehydrogenase [Nocardia caishijiensis]
MTTESAPRLGYIGLGNMGAPMARRLVDWPAGLVVCDARASATEKFAAEGVAVAETPAEVATRASVISVTVRDDTQVRDVLTGPQGILSTAPAGTVVAVHSTIADSTAIELAADCARHGVDLVDAPVSGGAPGAKQGRLAVMVGGSEAAFEAVRSPFARWADLVVHAGPVGAGTRMKLARNLVHFVAFAAAAEAARLAEAAGLDIRRLGEVVRHSDAVTGGPGAILWRASTTRLADGDPWLPIMSHVRDLGEKDLALALDLGARLGTELPLARLGFEHLAEGLGLPTTDRSST